VLLNFADLLDSRATPNHALRGAAGPQRLMKVGTSDANEFIRPQLLEFTGLGQRKDLIDQTIGLISGHVLCGFPELRGIKPNRFALAGHRTSPQISI
jgi:hypothetical protein